MAEINVTKAKSFWITPVLVGLILILAGALMAVFKKDALNWILIVSGVLLVIGGIITILATYNELRQISILGVLGLIFGIILIVIPALIANVLMVILAIVLILYGVVALLTALAGERKATPEMAVSVITGALSLVAGIYTVFNLNNATDIVMIVIGVLLILSGALQLFLGYRVYAQFH